MKVRMVMLLVTVVCLLGAGTTLAQGESPLPTPTLVSTPESTAVPTVVPTPLPDVPELEEPTNLLGVLGWLIAGGAAPSISLWLQKQKWFNQIQNEQTKVNIVLAAIVGVPLLAKALLTVVPPDVWAVVQPWFATAIAALEIGWPLSQATYLLMGRKLKPAQ